MTSSPSDLDLLISEHQHLGELFQRVPAALDETPSHPAELRALVEDLQLHLQEHFAHEEGQGLFPQLRSKAPHLSEEVAQLQKEHQTLAATVTTLIGNLSRDGWNADARLDWRRRFQHFQEAFREHEDMENRLLQEAYDRDEGTKD